MGKKGKEKMLQYPSFMLQYPCSTRIIPTSFLLPAQWPQPHSDELLLAMEESDFEEKKGQSSHVVWLHFEELRCLTWMLIFRLNIGHLIYVCIFQLASTTKFLTFLS
nr:uncharacterized protein LOC101267394 isoform X2 [Solanum lycopersicum]